MNQTNSLSNLIHAYADLEAKLLENSGEITEEMYEVVSLSEMLPQKVDKVQFVRERLKQSIEFFEEKEKQYQKYRKALEKSKERLDAYIKTTMLNNKIWRIEGEESALTIAEVRSKLVIDETELPKSYAIEVKTYEPDKERIREELKLGKNIPGATLEPSFALRTSVRKNK